MTDFGELKKLLAEATPGPWKASLPDDTTIIDQSRHPVATTSDLYERDYQTHFKEQEANAALIVAAVNALPALIARVEELEGALKFYANPNNHIGRPIPDVGVYCETSPVLQDRGDIARAALGGKQ